MTGGHAIHCIYLWMTYRRCVTNNMDILLHWRGACMQRVQIGIWHAGPDEGCTVCRVLRCATGELSCARRGDVRAGERIVHAESMESI